MSVRPFLSKASLALCASLLATAMAGAGDRSHTRYPNELEGFRFYAKYLSPLEPGVSGTEAVRRVLGDTAAVRRHGWTMGTTYTTRGGPIYNPTLGPLAEIIVRPDAVIPMGAVNFSSSFDHCHASVSEINISFDVYGDRFGLEYWLHEEDSQWGKKGDLYRIVYGPRTRRHSRNTIC